MSALPWAVGDGVIDHRRPEGSSVGVVVEVRSTGWFVQWLSVKWADGTQTLERPSRLSWLGPNSAVSIEPE